VTSSQEAVARTGSGQAAGIGFMMVSLVSLQVGNSFAKLLTHDMATPIGAVWLRMAFSSGILLLLALARWLVGRASARPSSSPQRRVSVVAAARHQGKTAWLFAIAYGVALVTMNCMFYEAISRIPVGIVVTIEFLGPLTVAILGSRRPIDFAWVGLAALGVAILGVTPTKLTWAGVAFSLAAAVCWAAYILLGSRVAKHWQGVGVLTGSCIGATVVLLPLFVRGGNVATVTGSTVGIGLLVALACTVLPYSLELAALHRLAPGLFAIIESLAPAIGALAAWWLIGESLHIGDWMAIACVVAASFGASWTAARTPRQSIG